MKLSKRTEYGVRAILHLARCWPSRFVQSKELAEQEKLPGKFLESILLALRRGSFLESKIGREGGYKLSRAPKEISVGDVVRRLEGRLSIKEGLLAADRSMGEVGMHLLNDQLTQAMDDVLNRMTLQELVDHVTRATSMNHEMYYI